MPTATTPVPANIVDLQRAIEAQPPHVASLAIARAFAVAGALSEWDSETIEHVLSELTLGLPAGVPDIDGTDYWRAIADQVGIEHDGESEDEDDPEDLLNGYDPDDDPTVGPDDSEDDSDRRSAGVAL